MDDRLLACVVAAAAQFVQSAALPVITAVQYIKLLADTICSGPYAILD
jgi:hypothetical protein